MASGPGVQILSASVPATSCDLPSSREPECRAVGVRPGDEKVVFGNDVELVAPEVAEEESLSVLCKPLLPLALRFEVHVGVASEQTQGCVGLARAPAFSFQSLQEVPLLVPRVLTGAVVVGQQGDQRFQRVDPAI